MIIKWRTSPYNENKALIERIECVRETATSVWHVAPARWGRSEVRRIAKRSTVTHYHDTWQEAYDHILEIAHHARDHAERKLRQTEQHLAQVRSLTPPPEIAAA